MISIIVPCFNEEEAIPLFFVELEKTKANIAHEFEYIFINDGSSDYTLEVLRNLARKHKFVRYLSFSRNFGKEAALYAGLQAASGELVTVMDVDLQDPPELLPRMVEMIETTDIDCVGTRRTDRKGEPLIRSFFAKKFYQLINKISDTEMVDGARDYRLMTRQMVDAILELTEHNRFSKGLFSWVGFKTEYLTFENRERAVGETSWSFWKLFNYSIDGIINFSDAPLNIASFVGAFSCVASAIAMVFIIVRALLFGDPTSGWPSLVTIILFIGGIQLLCIGIIGKYIGKIFMETKKRPVYIVKETENENKKNIHL
ncbi:glycosyltransferase family 2 protein [Enterococcus dongliensis]|uniref:Glycosyltransferase family 2 protein n=1 Tax=Enterococcus dongliensis TaxID=2559925 RepID=A0AAW8TL51_9ENTE|nr:glycosyltransferase family 2 protein [Enterococcus dongliensis]MDT2633439.1 glycosyltransferase family 2 protein [Enterococcus dongliensis]MDT2636790.1 glycosyltransferase family 2 protein [Enterococcus dongliensis]MDT2641339.1 glycosyltransferase family 2 protein [Enterococcus dongliensis]MDT2646559.1 glycosyltransferase family 2 protein [Enterococcus dongliensis]MDT2670791.1 glycosyltransferase family 2 protein [Enterococcus dongliensis]